MRDIRETLVQEAEFWRNMIVRYEYDASDDVVDCMREALLFAEFKLAQMKDALN